jgi:hypothetical protein
MLPAFYGCRFSLFCLALGCSQSKRALSSRIGTFFDDANLFLTSLRCQLARPLASSCTRRSVWPIWPRRVYVPIYTTPLIANGQIYFCFTAITFNFVCVRVYEKSTSPDLWLERGSIKNYRN